MPALNHLVSRIEINISNSEERKQKRKTEFDMLAILSYD